METNFEISVEFKLDNSTRPNAKRATFRHYDAGWSDLWMGVQDACRESFDLDVPRGHVHSFSSHIVSGTDAKGDEGWGIAVRFKMTLEYELGGCLMQDPTMKVYEYDGFSGLSPSEAKRIIDQALSVCLRTGTSSPSTFGRQRRF